MITLDVLHELGLSSAGLVIILASGVAYHLTLRNFDRSPRHAETVFDYHTPRRL